MQQRLCYILRWKGKRSKIIVIDSSHGKENKKSKMRKIKNKESIGEISQRVLIKQK